ncbi:MAG TPA: complex I NDUFA9 subunit family protein [Candidatus Limnocylindrales bacterium]
MATILVTGASGFVGSHVVPHLVAAGHRVVALARTQAACDRVRGRLAAPQRDAVDCRRGDVTDPASLGPALEGVDAIVHLVALPRDHTGGRDLERINVGGTRNILAAASAAGVRRFVHLGALGVVEDPALHYATSKARAERSVAESGLDWTILKPSLLWGERDGFFNILASLVRRSPGIVPLAGGGTSRFQPLAVSDLARTVVLCLERPETIRQTYELGGPGQYTYRELVQEVLRGMAARRLLVPMPVPLIVLVAATAEAARLPFPVATDQLRQLKLDNVTAPDSVRQGFGFEPRPMAGQLGYLRRSIAQQEPAEAGPSR